MAETVATSIQESHFSYRQTGAASSCGTRTITGRDVSAQTIRQESRIPLMHAWLSSIAFHGLVLLSLFPLFRESVITVHKESFHWDVVLVQSAPTTPEPAQATDIPRPDQPKQPNRTPTTASHANRAIRHAAASAERIVPTEQAAEPVASIYEPSIASSSASLRESPTASISDQPFNQRQESESPLPLPDPLANSMTTATSIPQAAAATSSDGAGRTMEPTQPLLSPATTSITESASTPRLDYGWLQQAIFRRLEELKRSSRPLLDQSQPFKVTVKAVVSNEGALLDSSVVKSSGLDRIDQEAIALVQRAFPLQLDRSLDRQQIVMRIPITYSQE